RKAQEGVAADGLEGPVIAAQGLRQLESHHRQRNADQHQQEPQEEEAGKVAVKRGHPACASWAGTPRLRRANQVVPGTLKAARMKSAKERRAKPITGNQIPTRGVMCPRRTSRKPDCSTSLNTRRRM